MSLSSAEGQGRHHKTCTGQFFTKSRGLLNIKIDATLHLIGPNTDFVATFDHTDTEQITIAIHKIRLIQQLEEVLNTLLSYTKWKKCCTKSDTQPASTTPGSTTTSKFQIFSNDIYRHQFFIEEEDPMKTKKDFHSFIFHFLIYFDLAFSCILLVVF
jgi:hypothetical protein